MDGSGCLTDWHTEVDAEFPLPFQRKHLGLENELMEILWHNGEAVLHRQTTKKPSEFSCQFNQVDEDDDEDEGEDDDLPPVPWSPANESFNKEFCPDLLPQIPATHQQSGKSAAEALGPILMPPRRFGSFETGDVNRTLDDLQFAYKNREGSNSKHRFRMPCLMTRETGHGSMDQTANEANTRLGCSKTLSAEKQLVGTENACSGGSGNGCQNTSSQSSDNTANKRKKRDTEELKSDAIEMESPQDGNSIPSKKPAPRRRRVAQVHNLSERRRRDRINEKMRALQALIPHSHKLDKASVLDEAIEYMKSLQLQLQWWMGSGMPRMMLPRTQQQYIYHAGLGIRPPALPPMQNLMRLPNQAMAVGSMPNQAPMGHGILPGHHKNQMQNATQPQPVSSSSHPAGVRNGTTNNMKMV